MSPRLDLFGQPDDLDEWPEEPDDSPLLEDDLGAMVGRYEGQSITDLIRDETGEGPPPATGRPWQRYYRACPYCGHKDSAAVNVDLGAFRCHACGTRRSTRWQASAYFSPQIRSAVEYVSDPDRADRYGEWVDKAELFQQGRELVNGYAYGELGGKNDSGKLWQWMDELGTEDAIRGRVYSVLRMDLMNVMEKTMTAYDQEKAARESMVHGESTRMRWTPKAERNAPTHDEYGEVGPSGARPRPTRHGMIDDDPVGNSATLGEAGELPWTHNHYRNGTDPADDCHECHAYNQIRCHCENSLRNLVMLRVSVPQLPELSWGVGKYATSLSRHGVAGLELNPATRTRIWERYRKRRQRARARGALLKSRNDGATGNGARWYGDELAVVRGLVNVPANR